jgi:hypothetical protein
VHQDNVRVLHHECQELEFFGRKMNFFIASPEQMTLQIELQISDLNHTGDPRRIQARSPENLSGSCGKLTSNLLREFFRYRKYAPLSSEVGAKL